MAIILMPVKRYCQNKKKGAKIIKIEQLICKVVALFKYAVEKPAILIKRGITLHSLYRFEKNILHHFVRLVNTFLLIYHT